MSMDNPPNYYAIAESEEAAHTPATPFAVMLRKLAEAAMSVTHHDTGPHEPEYWHEVKHMERRFRGIVMGYKAKQRNKARVKC